MDGRSPFHPMSGNVVSRLNLDKLPTLYKLTPGKQEVIIIPPDPMCRVLMPIHFGKNMARSRVCRQSTHCVDCHAEIPLTIHLYVGCYRGLQAEKCLMGLGTAIPKRWNSKLPDFRTAFKVWRSTATGPIFLEEQPYLKYDASAMVPWDTWIAVNAIFRGRMSAAATVTIAGEDPDPDQKWENNDEMCG